MLYQIEKRIGRIIGLKMEDANDGKVICCDTNEKALPNVKVRQGYCTMAKSVADGES